MAKEKELAAEPEKSGVDDETSELGTTSSPLDRVALPPLATFNGNDDAIAGIGEGVAGSISVFEGTRAAFVFVLRPSDGSTFGGLDDVAIVGSTGRMDAERVFVLRSRSSDGSIFGGLGNIVVVVVFALATIRTGRAASCCGIDIDIDSACSRFKSDGAKEPAMLVVLGELEFVVLVFWTILRWQERKTPGEKEQQHRTRFHLENVPFHSNSRCLLGRCV